MKVFYAFFFFLIVVNCEEKIKSETSKNDATKSEIIKDDSTKVETTKIDPIVDKTKVDTNKGDDAEVDLKNVDLKKLKDEVKVDETTKNNSNSTEAKLKIDVYYESLCPDSKQFITKQLYPAINKDEICNKIKLNVYPYGKSTTKQIEEGDYEFVCHHGEFECVGNKYHGCALKLIDGEKDSLKYVHCMMENIYFDENKLRRAPIDKCAELLGDDKSKIEECATSKQGDEYLAEYGRLTGDFQKPLKSVPTIVFNGKYDAVESQEAYNDFLKVLCGKFENKPKECAQ